MRTGIQGLRPHFRLTAQGWRGISDWGGQVNPSKPNRLKFWRVNQIDRFRPKQSQAIYLPCCQLDTAKFGPVFGKNGWSRPIKGLVNHQRRTNARVGARVQEVMW
jgi:hypothetical protein